MFEKVIGKTSKEILEMLTLEGEKSLSEIAEKLNISKPGVSKYLKNLKSIGIISEKREKTDTGIKVIYCLKEPLTLMLSINPSARSIINIKTNSTFSLPLLLLEQMEENEFKDDLKKLLEDILILEERSRPQYVILFGSVATGNATWKSDIDVAILDLNWNENRRKRIEKIISDVVMKTKHQIKPHFITLIEFEQGGSMLTKEIKGSGIIIYGSIYRRNTLWCQMKRYKNITL